MSRARYRYLVVPAVLGAGLLLICLTLLADLPDPHRIAGQPDAGTASILITDRHGRLLYEVIDPGGSKQVPLTLEQIPLACRQATIATEDSRFYTHPGFDLIAIGRAAWHNLRGDRAFSGASTLTQQVARNLFLSAEERSERTLRRKAHEAWLAWWLERRYSKDEILALYLNTTYYGHYAVGIEAAAQAYFGMHAAELDLAQCALLAGLPQYPAGYNPIENPEAARARQKTVLRLMIAQGYISAAEAQDAAAERLAFASTPFPIAAPHFVMWVQGQLETLLPPEELRRGGLRVITTLDLDWQRAAEETVRRRLAQLRPCAAAPDAIPGLTCDPRADPARRAENAALVALDPRTGAVLALVGSPDYFDPAISGAVNAALSLRQPGSAIKPLTYAAALDPARAARDSRPVFTAATVIPDLRAVFLTVEGEPYVPNNYDRVYHGPVTLRTALANSYNIPAVKTLDTIGLDALIEQANALGIPWQMADSRGQKATGRGQVGAQITDIPASSFQLPASTSRYGLSLTLGGGEVRLLDLTAAYAAFANGGRPVSPYAIERIEALEAGATQRQIGESATLRAAEVSIVPRPSNIPHSTSVLDPRVAYLITDILSDNNARLPAFGAGNVLEIGRPAAVKTGTTTDWRDNWTIGYTPELVTGVWVGNADNTPMKDVSGISGAGPIWHDFMRAVLRDTPPSAFPVPEGLVQVEICADSGLLPARDTQYAVRNTQYAIIPCPHRRLEWFIAGTEPTEVDRSHYRVVIDTRTGRLADATTPPQYRAPQIIWQLPPEYQAWARANGIPQLADSERQMADGRWQIGEGSQKTALANVQTPTSNLQLTSPDPNRAYRIAPELPLSAQEIPVTAFVAVPSAKGITLLLDGRPFATVFGPDYTAWWPLQPGRHTFQAVATHPDGREERSAEVVVFVE